jgi:hypothetical protein
MVVAIMMTLGFRAVLSLRASMACSWFVNRRRFLNGVRIVVIRAVMMRMVVLSMMLIVPAKGCNHNENGPYPGPNKANQQDWDEDELKQADNEYSDIASEESEQGCCQSGKKELTKCQENGGMFFQHWNLCN